jgi:hypothetical protein
MVTDGFLDFMLRRSSHAFAANSASASKEYINPNLANKIYSIEAIDTSLK